MLIFAHVTNKQNVCWLKQWNQSLFIQEVQKLPKVGLLDVIFDKWLHKVIFWFQVMFPFMIYVHCICFKFSSLSTSMPNIKLFFDDSSKWRLASCLTTLGKTLIFQFWSLLRCTTLYTSLDIEGFNWELAFFREFKHKGGVLKSKTQDQQYGDEEATKRVVYKYVTILFPPIFMPLRSLTIP